MLLEQLNVLPVPTPAGPNSAGPWAPSQTELADCMILHDWEYLDIAGNHISYICRGLKEVSQSYRSAVVAAFAL